MTKTCILVVDDRRATRILIRNVLIQDGYRVLEAENGQEAIDTFLIESPELILLDIVMPVMDGLTACEKIRRLPDGNRTPILMFTGVNDGKSVEAAFQAGASDFINKPINWEELRYRVQRLLHLRSVEEKVQRQVYYDSLTNLPNRLLFKDRLEVAIFYAASEQLQLAVLYLNLKKFTLINDAFGYDAGDMVIREVAQRLQTAVGQDVTVARMGGDDFAFILNRIEHEEEAAKIAAQVIEAINEPWSINRQEVYIDSDIGIALYPDDGQDVQTLLKNAETAMQQAALEHRNTYRFYNHDMNTKALERIGLENALRHAIDKNELIIHYQPKFQSCMNKVTGVEALIRWQHPERGMVPPMEFIPIAEENQLIIPIGEWVLRTACMQMKEWHDAGHRLSLSVNFSALQFRQLGVSDRVYEILSEIGLEPNCLTIEITESVAMKDVNYTVKTLNALQEKGVKVSIDDFGTGYSSLSYLKRLPISELKIDRSFVRDITTDQDDAAIVEMILVLGQTLKLNMVAEGVETPEQVEFLRDKGCLEMQGYLFSKPITAEEFQSKFLQF
ncbi:putative bifunctional diguanylate cyclase/phosphodiesterase [Desulfuribacillus alkaliarsenatis]|uniref:putative bifunctional diguanylate cyclase/phosphodiesterase n=1 Tax=Desulfuribacillus alkaliarsenatis TaxID=766136 RepID=UPI000AA586EA|nr:EAL domain-containing response regulator [Desulfuribacillus alkaliarsenatis]